MARHHQALIITHDLACLPQVRELVSVAVQQGGFPTNQLNRLQIAVDEAITNIIEHGYEGKPYGAAHIQITVSVTPDEFRVTIVDQGSSFDPGESKDIDIQKHVAMGHSGGLGVFLMRKIMDVVDYHYETGRRNRLLLVKYRPTTGTSGRTIFDQ
jgi:serine/threonine-protein kinase RsbW